MRMLPGTQLNAQDQQHVLAAYVHRFTREHVPAWAAGEWKGTPCPVQFASDYDWLEHTLFAVRADGRLDQRRRFCESYPTWPDNPELRPPPIPARAWPRLHAAVDRLRGNDDRQLSGSEV